MQEERETKLRILQQIVLGVSQLQEMKIIHGDLKPENILLDAENRVRIADFGTLKIMRSTVSYSIEEKLVLTPAYSPPELIATGQRNSKTDVWGVGCIMLYVLTGVPPYANVPREGKVMFIRSKAESVVDNYLKATAGWQ
jgi:serine/threonine protein kinase